MGRESGWKRGEGGEGETEKVQGVGWVTRAVTSAIFPATLRAVHPTWLETNASEIT